MKWDTFLGRDGAPGGVVRVRSLCCTTLCWYLEALQTCSGFHKLKVHFESIAFHMLQWS